MEIGTICAGCRNKNEELYEGWRTACKAFPEGIPSEYIDDIDYKNKKVCNNGIGYEPESKGLKKEGHHKQVGESVQE